MDIDPDSAQVRIPPPLALLACVLTGAALQWAHPLHLIAGPARWVLGTFLFGVGFSTVLYCARTFNRAETKIEPWKTTSNVVTTGIYGYSRNPIYFSFLMGCLGIAVLADSAWIALMAVPLFVFLRQYVIKREEAYLEQKFGKPYLEYKAKVRRWI